MWVYWKYISNCLTMCKVKPYYYVKLEIYFQLRPPILIYPSILKKKFLEIFTVIPYLCKK